MGTWGPGIFGNDTASDVRDEFRELIEDGVEPDKATAQILRNFAHRLDDPDEGPAFWTGLAAIQARLGRLQPDVKERALGVIGAGGDLHMWEGSRERAQRQQALEKLRAELLGPPKKPTKVRKPVRVESRVRPGQVISLSLPGGGEARLRVLGLQSSRVGDFPIVELLDERGRRFRPWALWMVMSIVPEDDPGEGLRVLGGEPAPTGLTVDAPTSLDWRGLAQECQQILSELRQAH